MCNDSGDEFCMYALKCLFTLIKAFCNLSLNPKNYIMHDNTTYSVIRIELYEYHNKTLHYELTFKNLIFIK